MHPSPYIFEARHLVKTFHKGKSNEISPVLDVNIRLLPGHCAVLQGASGSGKSTLLSMLACLSRPSEGAYFCMGEQVSRWSEKFLTKFRRRHIGMIFQNFQLIEGLSVAENIGIPLLPLAKNRQEMETKVKEAAEKVGLLHKLKESTDTLSGGERQRTAIARALVNRPALLLADEPTAHLDRKNAAEVLGLLAGIKAQGTSIVIATHDPLVLEQGFIDKLWLMQDSNIVEE